MLRRLLFIIVPVAVVGAAEAPKMKTIKYRGGVITFRVPASWKEEYEPEGGGTFYDSAPDAGVLRLNVIAAKAPKGKLPLDGYHHLASEPLAKGERLSKTENGDGIKFKREAKEDEGHKLAFYSWEVVHCAPPDKLYVAVFTWTILAAQDGNQKAKKELELIDAEVSKAHFHPDLGKL